MQADKNHLEHLKAILECFRVPEQLDNHPWTVSLLVQAARAAEPSLAGKSPGWQLVLAIAGLFRQMMPNTPPQTGKRLDTRWGRFGILAANYFAPLLYGRLYPRTLREAWRRIDQAILLFVYGKTEDQLEPGQVEPYRLVGEEHDLVANSTVSDWHRGGLQELADFLLNHEVHLSRTLDQPSPLLEAAVGGAAVLRQDPPSHRRRTWRWGLLAASLLVLGLVLAAALKVQHLRSQVNVVRADIAALEALDLTSLESLDLDQAGDLLARTKQDVATLQAQAAPWLWLAPRLGWVPVYGGDLKHAGGLLEMASALLDAADTTYQAAFPIWQAVYQDGGEVGATELTAMLVNTKPALLQAQADLQKARQARQTLDPRELSPRTRRLVERVDPYLVGLDEALTLSLALPGLLGGAEDGPKTYLILVQNEDELRPTGGFITSVGKVVVFKGELVSWSMEDSYSVDDINKLYPLAPWQMRSFMNIPVFVFRDANWYTDYPTAAAWAEYLYAYTNSFSVDGVIAIDQHVLVSILSITGPVYVRDLDTTITAENVREIMRAQKIPPPAEERDPDWHRKQFMKPIIAAVLDRLLTGQDISWKAALTTLMADLDRRHILVQLDDPTLTALLAERGWDGAVRNAGGDFLMVVDTNVGYNKVNAVVSSRLEYDVDLTDLSAPRSSLTVFHKNAAQSVAGEPCDQRPATVDQSSVDYWYPINRCYYNYLRVYLPAGTQLMEARPHAVTREEMIMLDQDLPARVDRLNEGIENVDGFGTLLVVPTGQSLDTGFKFKLPGSVLQPGSEADEKIYRLKIQKQAGVLPVPVTLRIHLPAGVEVRSTSPAGLVDGRNILFDLELQEDIQIEVVFRP